MMEVSLKHEYMIVLPLFIGPVRAFSGLFIKKTPRVHGNDSSNLHKFPLARLTCVKMSVFIIYETDLCQTIVRTRDREGRFI